MSGVTEEPVVTFGSFRLFPRRQALFSGDKRVPMSGTMFELLMVLLERPGELISQQELMEHVWPGRTIDSSNVRSQVAVLRRTLGCSKRGERFIATSSGRGYRFAAPVSFGKAEPSAPAIPVASVPPTTRLALSAPWCAGSVIGRDAEIAAIADHIAQHRQLTITGQPGGGKTTVALAAASAARHFDGAHLFAPEEDLSQDRFEQALAASMDPACTTTDPREALASLIGTRAVLLVVDGADRHLDATATFAEWLLTALPRCALLVTSCEALGGAFEDVLRLPALELPGEGADADAILGCASVSLLCARLGRAHRDAAPAELAALAARAGGNPLAIELVAAEARTIGAGVLLDMLDDALLLSLQRRSGPVRQRSLLSMMEAACADLKQAELDLLARLTATPGRFTVEQAAQAARCPTGAVTAQLRVLVGRSLVETCTTADGMRYQLPQPVRAFAARCVAPSLGAAPLQAEMATRHAADGTPGPGEGGGRESSRRLRRYGPSGAQQPQRALRVRRLASKHRI